MAIVAKNCHRLKEAFPSLSDGFYSILLERLKDNGFTNERVIDAINNCIDTCIYPTPTIAQILSWDKRVKTFTHSQIVKEVANGYSFNDFISVDLGFNNYPLYVYRYEFDKNKFKKFEPKKKAEDQE